MCTLRVSLFLFILLFHGSVFSEALEERAKTVETIFITFMTDLLSKDDIPNAGEQFDKLAESSWLDDIVTATEKWTVDEVREFLHTLQDSGIQSGSILNILQAIDYIRVLKGEFHFTFSGEDRPASQRQNAGKVFLDFVKTYLGTSEDRMGSDWRENIFHHTRFWPMTDAQNFLEVLVNSSFQLDSILRLLQAPDYLEKLRTGQINLNFLQRSNVVIPDPASLQTKHSTKSQSGIMGQNAGDIFIQRAKQYFREEFEEEENKKYKNMSYEEAFQKRMGPEWEDRIQKYTQYWATEDAIALLDYLSHRIGKMAVLDRIKTTSYFAAMRSYRRFIERVEFYKGYIGGKEVTKRLSRSLGGFERGDIEEIKKAVEFLEEYLGNREIVQEMMLKSLEGFSRLSGRAKSQTNLNNIKDVIAYLGSIGIAEEQIKSMIFDNFAGFVLATRRKLEIRRQLLMQKESIGLVFISDEINKMIEKSLEAFLRSDLHKVKEMVAYLKNKDTGLGFKDETIKAMAISNLQGLAADPETLSLKKASLTKTETIGVAFTSAEINKMIEKSIEAFLRADLQKVKEMVAYLRNKDTGLGFKDDTIKAMAIRNLKGLSADPEILRSKKGLLMQAETIGLVFTSAEINQMIAESIKGFLQADLHKVKKMVAYLRSIDFEDETIKAMAIRNLQGLSADPETLRSKKAFLTKAETIGLVFTSDELNKMIAENIQGFLQADLHKVKEMVAYLRNKDTGLGFKDATIKAMAISNLLGLAFNPETLSSKKELLMQAETVGLAFTSDEIDKMIAESIQGFLQADLRKVKRMVGYLKNKDTGLGFKDDTIKDMVIRNLQGLAADPEALNDRKELLMQEETIGLTFAHDELNKMIEKDIRGFLRADLKKVKEIVRYLKDIGFKYIQIKDMAIRNFVSFFTIKSYELNNMIESFKKEPQLRGVEEKTLMKEIREMIITQGLTDFFYYNFDANLKSLTCTYALSN